MEVRDSLPTTAPQTKLAAKGGHPKVRDESVTHRRPVRSVRGT